MAGPSDKTQTSTGAAEAKASGAFPPFNPDGFSSQLIWLAIAFGALYVLLKRVALPRVASVLDERRSRIDRDLETADRLKRETETALAGYEQALADAKSKASAIAKDAQAKLAADTDREKTSVEQQIAAKLVEAEGRISDTKSRALAQINDIASDTAGVIVARLGGGEATTAEIRQALTPAAGE